MNSRGWQPADRNGQSTTLKGSYESLTMSTFTQIYYHIVFSTKDRKPVLLAAHRKPLFGYIWGIIKNNMGHVYRINGVEDHLHIFTSLHPSVCLADLVKAIKISAGLWIKSEGLCPGFTHWQNGYGAFTHSNAEKGALIAYVRGQEEHHKKTAFQDELRKLLVEAGIEYDERYLL